MPITVVISIATARIIKLIKLIKLLGLRGKLGLQAGQSNPGAALTVASDANSGVRCHGLKGPENTGTLCNFMELYGTFWASEKI